MRTYAFTDSTRWQARVSFIVAIVLSTTFGFSQTNVAMAHPGTEAPDTTLTLQMPFVSQSIRHLCVTSQHYLHDCR
jgi:hypothetical protein